MLRATTLLTLCLALAGCEGPDTPVAGGPPRPVTELSPAASALRRLSAAQYTNSIHDIFGADIIVPPASRLEPDVDSSGYLSVDSSSVTISRRGVAQYEAAAYDIAGQAMDASRRTRFVTCAPAAPDDSNCARTVLAALGLRLYRRPMTSDELEAATYIATRSAIVLMDFYEGLEFGIALLLQSPSFLFREELGVDLSDGSRRYSSYEMASRMSHFLWNTTPDEALLDDAASGALSDDAGLAAATERMLLDPRADQGAREFAFEWLGLAGLDDLVKDPTVYTQISPEVGPSAREETLAVVAHFFRTDQDARELMTTRETFLNRKLASMYVVRAPREDFGLVTFDEGSPRPGILGHISILALYAHPVSTSPTLRGRFVRERLLCDPIPQPPVGVNTAIPEPSADAPTLRVRLAAHQQVDYCGSCHRRMDGIGLGLEAFDGLGRFRRMENGIPIDASGDLDGRTFDDARELGQVIHDDPRFASCITQQMYRIATGHIETDGERETLRDLRRAFADGGYSLSELMEAIVLSDGFRRAVAQSEEEAP
jgi:hypothetical protein